MLGVIDCNNFFVSCERVLQPALCGKAVVVLSNNDGCVIARSNEAKALGIAMGVPLFKIREWINRGDVIACSSDHVLYGNLSRQVMSLLKEELGEIEQCSIDECFVEMEGGRDLVSYGEELVRKVELQTGIPVSIGWAATKTLAKLADRFAKRYPAYHGSCMIETEEQRKKALSLTPVGEIWGIGRKMRDRLTELDITCAENFADCEESFVRQHFHLPGFRTWKELNGISMLHLEKPSARKSIQCTRSFRTPIADHRILELVVADFSMSVAAKLRKEQAAARSVSVFICTDRFNTRIPYSQKHTLRQLLTATNDPREMAAAAQECLKQIYQDGFPVKRIGVYADKIETKAIQQDLFDDVDRIRQRRLMKSIDNILAKNGKGAIRLASQGDIDYLWAGEHLRKKE